jgi:hypothetical protein
MPFFGNTRQGYAVDLAIHDDGRAHNRKRDFLCTLTLSFGV